MDSRSSALGRSGFSRPGARLVALAAGLLLASCTSGPFAEDETRPERIPIDEQSLEGEEAPALTSVPTEAPSVTPLEERQALQQQLRDDRASARAEVAAQQEAVRGDLQGDSQRELAAVIQFAYGSAALDARDREILEQVARVRQERSAGLLIVGHSSAGDDQGDAQAEANLKMSERRANAVAEGLRSVGVAPEDLHVQALGDRDLQYQETDATGEAGNRRVEIFLM